MMAGNKRKGKEHVLKKQRGGTSEAHDTAAEEVRIVKPDWNRSNRKLDEFSWDFKRGRTRCILIDLVNKRRQVFERTDVPDEEVIFDVDDEEQNQEEDEERRGPIQSVPQQGQGSVSKVLQHPIGFGRWSLGERRLWEIFSIEHGKTLRWREEQERLAAQEREEQAGWRRRMEEFVTASMHSRI
ncbi:hypothetical protein L1987_21384 [Smallanthus sonchifolius]|uniref:Uncharacterized protein n=1 Tax=Smallanthus sonchifolius TaxID=185202 RepID=A0ACB9IU79_9ASTR|nr:hypothetical protein L1987_21384 [Smallanthus sonchifolius]